jgi:hypothetical protein
MVSSWLSLVGVGAVLCAVVAVAAMARARIRPAGRPEPADELEPGRG